MKTLVFAALLLVSQVDPSGMTYEERLTYVQQRYTEAAQMARRNVREPYFGTICE